MLLGGLDQSSQEDRTGDLPMGIPVRSCPFNVPQISEAVEFKVARAKYGTGIPHAFGPMSSRNRSLGRDESSRGRDGRTVRLGLQWFHGNG